MIYVCMCTYVCVCLNTFFFFSFKEIESLCVTLGGLVNLSSSDSNASASRVLALEAHTTTLGNIDDVCFQVTKFSSQFSSVFTQLKKKKQKTMQIIYAQTKEKDKGCPACQ